MVNKAYSDWQSSDITNVTDFITVRDYESRRICSFPVKRKQILPRVTTVTKARIQMTGCLLQVCYRPYGFPGSQVCERTIATEHELRAIEPCAVYVVTVVSLSPSGLRSDPLEFYVNTDEAGTRKHLSYLSIGLFIYIHIYLSDSVSLSLYLFLCLNLMRLYVITVLFQWQHISRAPWGASFLLNPLQNNENQIHNVIILRQTLLSRPFQPDCQVHTFPVYKSRLRPFLLFCPQTLKHPGTWCSRRPLRTPSLWPGTTHFTACSASTGDFFPALENQVLLSLTYLMFFFFDWKHYVLSVPCSKKFSFSLRWKMKLLFSCLYIHRSFSQAFRNSC